MSRKNTPPSYTDPGGPSIVEFHSYRLSPFGPALQKTKNKKKIKHERKVYGTPVALQICFSFIVISPPG